MSQTSRNRDLFAAAALGALANFPWEMGHLFLYRPASSFAGWQHVLCCGLAALVDGAGIAVIFGMGRCVFREDHWPLRRSFRRIAFVLILGLLGAVLTERLALRLNWWSYTPTMPRVPGTDLGVTPLAQFAVLPLLVLFVLLARRWHSRTLDETRIPH